MCINVVPPSRAKDAVVTLYANPHWARGGEATTRTPPELREAGRLPSVRFYSCSSRISAFVLSLLFLPVTSRRSLSVR